MIIFSNFSSLFSIMSKSWIGDVVISLGLLILGWVYQFVSYCFKLFTLMCQMNFNSIYGIISPLIDRLKALVMVFIMFKLAISLITYLFNPDSAPKEGKQLIINIGITAALLISYNYIFTLMNEISMLVIGAPDGYQFTVLSDLIDADESADEGLISRFIFGSSNVGDNVGDYVAYNILSIFIYDTSTGQSDTLAKTIATPNGIDFSKLRNISIYVNKTVKYIPFLGTIMAAYLVICVAKTSIEIGIRMFKLVLLQILAPIAIISIIEEGTKNGKFKKFIDMYIEIYIEAFVRMFSMLISIVFISKFIANIGDFFGTSTFSGNDSFITKGLLTIIICVAGIKFTTEMPKIIDNLLGTHMADSKGGFGSFIGGLVGSAIGGATALGETIAGGGGIGTGLANMVSGQVRGFQAGAKGNNISEKIKNISGANAKTKGNVADMISRGGFGAVAGGAIGTAVGMKTSQDRQMEKYDKQTAALDRFDAAQKEAIADQKMGTTMTGAEKTKYSQGYNDIKFGTDKDAYVDKMMEFDTDYQYAKSKYDSISSKEGSTPGQITAAQQELLKAREEAKARAGKIYDDHKNAASSDEIDRARADVEKSGIDTSHGIDVKAQKAAIKEQKRELENKQSYKNTHGGSKK